MQRATLPRAASLGGITATLAEAPTYATIELQGYQQPPAGEWRTWAFKAARDTGKTLAASTYVIEHLRQERRAARVVIGAPTDDDAILTCAEGPTGLITLFRNEFTRWNRGTGEAWHYLGGYVRFMGCNKPSRWHGGNWSLRWLDEVPFCNPRAIEEGDFAVRLGERPRDIWTMTPFSISRWLKDRLTRRGVVVTRATIYDNKYASPRAVADFEALYKNTTLGKAFLLGEDVDIPEGAIWPMLGERREDFLKTMPEGLRFVRGGAGVDWGMSATHHSIAIGASETPEGIVWVRRAYRGIQKGSKPLILALHGMKRDLGITWAAYDRSQSGLEDWIEDGRLDQDGQPVGAGLIAIKGNRNVDWRGGLVFSALEQGRLFFDSEGDGVSEAFDYLTQYHRDDAGKVVEEEDDDADGLCYVFAELDQPGVSIPPNLTLEGWPDLSKERRIDPYHFPEGRRAPENPGGLELRGGSQADDGGRGVG